MTDKLRYVFMEVEPFEKTYEDCTTFEEKFLYYMKNLPTFVDKPDTHNDKFFEELLMEAEYLKMDTETQAQYERRVKQMRDAKNLLRLGVDVETISKATGLSVEELVL